MKDLQLVAKGAIVAAALGLGQLRPS